MAAPGYSPYIHGKEDEDHAGQNEKQRKVTHIHRKENYLGTEEGKTGKLKTVKTSSVPITLGGGNFENNLIGPA